VTEPGGEDSVDVTRAVALLRAQAMDRILCEGGPTLLDELVNADVIVEICVTLPRAIAAIRAGGDAARARVGGWRLPVPEVSPLSRS
jgi:riboflavin biosynthesis pyrimidine reductase